MSLPATAPHLKSHFDANAADAAPASENMPDVQEIVAAILGNEHSLSAEQLIAFESLLEDPETDRETKQALLQTIWDVVVCIIDHQWEYARMRGLSGANACGTNANPDEHTPERSSDVVEYSQAQIAEEQDKTAAKSPRRKGCHDSD